MRRAFTVYADVLLALSGTSSAQKTLTTEYGLAVAPPDQQKILKVSVDRATFPDRAIVNSIDLESKIWNIPRPVDALRIDVGQVGEKDKTTTKLIFARAQLTRRRTPFQHQDADAGTKGATACAYQPNLSAQLGSAGPPCMCASRRHICGGAFSSTPVRCERNCPLPLLLINAAPHVLAVAGYRDTVPQHPGSPPRYTTSSCRQSYSSGQPLQATPFTCSRSC